MTKRLRKEDWTERDNEIFENLAKNTWESQKDFFEEVSKQIPKVKSLSQALLHAKKHLGLNIETLQNKLDGQALSHAKELLLLGKDSIEVSNKIGIRFGTYLPNTYYNNLRFRLKRGDYAIVTVDGKQVFEHRAKAAKRISITHRVPLEKATKMLSGKLVSHPVTQSVADNDYKNLFVTDRKRLNKIKDINMVNEVLGLPYGTLLKNTTETQLADETPRHILTKMFEELKLKETALAVFEKKDLDDQVATAFIPLD